MGFDKKAYNKQYYKDNREKLMASQANRELEYRKLHTLGFYMVYKISNYDNKGNDYVGVTNQPHYRFHQHKYNKNVSQISIIEFFDERREALDLEKIYHDKGCHGKNPTYK